MTNSVLTSQDATLSNDLDTLANKINDLHDRAIEVAKTTVKHARECGELLIQAKDQIGHGRFRPWLEANCRVKPRQAQKLMRLAREWPAIEDKCASNAHLTIDGALRLLQPEAAEVEGGTTPPMAVDDPEDPFGLADDVESERQRTPDEEFKIQRSKTIKTAEALMRAFDDLQRLKESPKHEATIEAVVELIRAAKAWPK